MNVWETKGEKKKKILCREEYFGSPTPGAANEADCHNL